METQRSHGSKLARSANTERLRSKLARSANTERLPLVAPIEMATGKKAYFCGKPNPLMMRTGLRLLGCHSAEAVMIGDRMDTDVISGMESGMSTVLVLSGVSTRDTLDTYAYRPSIVLNGVGDIPKLAEKNCAKTE